MPLQGVARFRVEMLKPVESAAVNEPSESAETDELICLFLAQRLAMIAAFDKMTASQMREIAAELFDYERDTLPSDPAGDSLIPEGFTAAHADGVLASLRRQAKVVMSLARRG